MKYLMVLIYGPNVETFNYFSYGSSSPVASVIFLLVDLELTWIT